MNADPRGPAPLQPTEVAAAPTRAQRVALLDGWLASLLPERPGLALVAVGGLGRREPAPYGDLDLVLVHDKVGDIATIANDVWYPIWDAGLRLDHSVRTVDQAARVAQADAVAGIGLLDVRAIAGDQELAEGLRQVAAAAWRSKSRTLLPALRTERAKRIEMAGDTAYLVEPDLKEGRGGTRDVLVLRALAAAQLCDPPGPPVEDAHRLLLDVRDALQRSAGRATDVLVRQDQSSVARALHLGSEDDLLRQVSAAARAISFATAGAWRRVSSGLESGRRGGLLRRRKPLRTPLLEGVVVHAGEVSLARGANPGGDPVLALRVATAAAESRLPISPATLAVLVEGHSPLPDPWPEPARTWFVRLLAAGPGLVDVFEALDQSGLWLEYFPEWRRIRALPQRHPLHLYTVDRHLIEAAAVAADLTRRVRRPDLLLIGALLHDIGKGGQRDHCVEGAEIAAPMARRMGLNGAAVATVTLMVDQHLLLPHTAMRRDPSDPATIGLIADRIEGRLDHLDLLHALAEADARATGPGVWTPWRAHVIADLVARVAAALAPDDPGARSLGGGATAPEGRHEGTGSTQAAMLGVAGDGAVRVALQPDLDGFEVAVDATNRSGLLSHIAGVLALHQLEIRRASVSSTQSQAHGVFAVRPLFGRPPEPSVLAADLRSSLAGTLALGQRLAAKERAYRPSTRVEQASEVIWYDDAADEATVVEVRAADRAGLLHRLTAVFEQAGIDVLSARLETFGADAIDVFYLPVGAAPTEPSRRGLSEMLRAAASRP